MTGGVHESYMSCMGSGCRTSQQGNRPQRRVPMKQWGFGYNKGSFDSGRRDNANQIRVNGGADCIARAWQA
jgi:hypothetical protein